MIVLRPSAQGLAGGLHVVISSIVVDWLELLLLSTPRSSRQNFTAPS